MFDKTILLQHMQNREKSQEQRLKEAMDPNDAKSGLYGRNPERVGEGEREKPRQRTAHIVPHENKGEFVYSRLPFKGKRETIGLGLPLPSGIKFGDTVTDAGHLSKIKTHLKNK